MTTKSRGKTSLTAFVEETKDENKEEIKSILEMQEFLEQLFAAEERLQVYQLKVTSNW